MTEALKTAPTANATASGTATGEVKTTSETLLGAASSEAKTAVQPAFEDLYEVADKAAEDYLKEPTEDKKKLAQESLAKARETLKTQRESKVKTEAEAKAKAEADAKLKVEQALLISADKLKLPANSLIQPARLSEIAEQAKKEGLSLEQAQARLESEHQLGVRFQTEGQARMKAQGEKWLSEIQKDPNLGGQNFEKTNDLATMAIYGHLGEEEGKAFMADLRALNVQANPRLIKLLASIGSKMEPKALVSGTGTKTDGKPLQPWEKVYAPNTKEGKYDPRVASGQNRK